MADSTSEGIESGNGWDSNATNGNEGSDNAASNSASDTGGLRIVDPSSGTVKRGRGRPPGSGKSQSSAGSAARTEKGKAAQNAIGLDTVLFSLHGIAAAFIIPELAIDKDEAKMLAEGVNAINQHYGKTIDPKVVAWIGMVAVAGKVYGPRVAAFSMRKSMEKKQLQAPRPIQKPAEKPANPLTASVVNLFQSPEMVSLPDNEG